MITLFIFMLMVSAEYSYVRFMNESKGNKDTKMKAIKKAIMQALDENLITIIGLFVLEAIVFVCFGSFFVSLKEFIIYLTTK